MDRIIAITQARCGSTRLPAKVLKTIGGQTLLEIHLERIKKSSILNDIIVATTVSEGDERIVSIADKVGLSSYRGSENDVLDRYYQAALPYKPDYVVRVTSDCPLIDPQLIDNIVNFAIDNNLDYASGTLNQTGYPDGEDVEVFKFDALATAWKNASLKSEREHVTSYIYNNSSYFGKDLFKSDCYSCPEGDFTHIRLTVDEPQDFEVVKILIENLGIDKTWQEYTKYYIEHKLNEFNGSIERAAGYKKSLMND